MLKPDVIKKKIEEMHISLRKFAELAGIPASSFNAWLSDGRNIKYSNAEKIAKALRCNIEEISIYKDLKTLGIIPSDLPPPPDLKSVPVLSFAQAAGFEPTIEPICDFLNNHADIQETFVNVKPGYFALNVEGDSMSPEYPAGTVILVAGGEYPQRGDIVAAKLSSGEVIVKEYHRKDNVITLASLNPSGKTFVWRPRDPENQGDIITWMYPVVEAKINVRKRRWERTFSYSTSAAEEPPLAAEDRSEYKS